MLTCSSNMFATCFRLCFENMSVVLSVWSEFIACVRLGGGSRVGWAEDNKLIKSLRTLRITCAFPLQMGSGVADRNSITFHRISWISIEFHGILFNSSEFHGIP